MDGLEELRAMVCESAARVEAAVFNAVAALVQADGEKARSIVAADTRIEDIAAAVDHSAVHLIALHRPLANDLREVLATFKISGVLVRMSDCARNIARRTQLLSSGRRLDQVTMIAGMAQAVLQMMKTSLDAFSGRDLDAAAVVRQMDCTVDNYYESIFNSLVDEMAKDPQRITAATHLLVVAQKLERTGDHAVAISRLVEFALAGAGSDHAPAMLLDPAPIS